MFGAGVQGVAVAVRLGRAATGRTPAFPYRTASSFRPIAQLARVGGGKAGMRRSGAHGIETPNHPFVDTSAVPGWADAIWSARGIAFRGAEGGHGCRRLDWGNGARQQFAT